jgi:hypothetical protein
VSDCLWVVSHEVVEGDAEGTGLLSEEVGVILYSGHFLPNWKELVRQLTSDHLFETFSEELEGGAQEVGLQEAHIILAMHGEVSIFAADDELAVHRLAASEEVSVVWHLHGAILQSLGLCLVVGSQGLALLHQSVEMRIVTEDALLRTITDHLSQVVLIVGE